MSRLTSKLENAGKTGEKLLSIFVTAGYPEIGSLPDLIGAIEEGGADFVEIGIPFSDPLADGPTIQRSSQVALDNGMTLRLVLEQVKTIRRRSDLPMILMGYLNPIMRFGAEAFGKAAEDADIDGFIIPDLIPEELERFQGLAINGSSGVNFLVSPNTPAARVETINSLTRDFVYCVSVTGVTGSRAGVPAGLIEFLRRMKETLTHPYMVGFGISTPEDARDIARHCDGVIVGSALINLIEQYGDNKKMLNAVTQYVSSLKNALKGV